MESDMPPPPDLDAIEERATWVYPVRGWNGGEAERALRTVTEDVPVLIAYAQRLEAELAAARAGLTQQALLLALPTGHAAGEAKGRAAEREACAALCERMAHELETVPMGPIRDAVARRDLAVSELRRAAGRIRAGGRDG